MKKLWSDYLKIAAFALISITLAFAGLLLIILWPKFSNMKSEYATARVIQETANFIDKSNGQWPKSWRDLACGDSSEYTRMNFALDPTKATMADVCAAIVPKNGKFYTYPGRKRLAHLFSTLKSYQTNLTDTNLTTNTPPN